MNMYSSYAEVKDVAMVERGAHVPRPGPASLMRKYLIITATRQSAPSALHDGGEISAFHFGNAPPSPPVFFPGKERRLESRDDRF